MSIVPDFKHDVFVSYSRADNARPQGDERKGWVDVFCSSLEIGLRKTGMRSPAIWWDVRSMDGGHLFDNEVIEAINTSAVMVVMTSRSHRSSEYCQKEIEWFYRKAEGDRFGLSLGNRPRIQNALIADVPFTEWPKWYGYEFGKRSAGHQFFNEDDGIELEPYSREFERTIRVLAGAVRELLDGMLAKLRPAEQEQAAIGGDGEVAHEVFMANVTDSLVGERKRIVRVLQEVDVSVFEKPSLPLDEPKHSEEFARRAASSMLTIHLIDDQPGQPVGDEQVTRVRKQADLSIEHAQSLMIWVPRSVDIDDIEELEVEDLRHREFLKYLRDDIHRPHGKYDFIRCSSEELLKTIADKVGKLRRERSAKVAKAEVASGAIKKSAFVDAHIADHRYAVALTESLQLHGILPILNPYNDDRLTAYGCDDQAGPLNTGEIMRSRIAASDAVMSVYGEVSPEHVQNRVIVLKKMMLAADKPPDTPIFVCVAPPEEKDPEVVRSNDLKTITLDQRRGLDDEELKPLWELLEVA